MKFTEQEIEALERGIAEDKSRISYLEQRVKELEATVVRIRNERIPEYDRLKFENDGLRASVKALKDALWKLTLLYEDEFDSEAHIFRPEWLRKALDGK